MANIRIILTVLAVYLSNISARPSDDGSTTHFMYEAPTDAIDDDNVNDGEDFPTEQIMFTKDDNTQEILDKINALNQGLVKPSRTNNKNTQSHTNGGYVLDSETLQKIQQIIAAGKLNAYSDVQKDQESNTLSNERTSEKTRALQYGMLPADLTRQVQGTTPRVPYLTSIPVLVMPSSQNYQYEQYVQSSNSLEPNLQFQTRQGPPTLPFNIQWPLAPFFPILVKDPLLGFLHGGGWNNFFEYGQNADVCNRKQKAIDDEANEQQDSDIVQDKESTNLLTSERTINSREGRAIKKRHVVTVAPRSKTQEKSKKLNKFFGQKPTSSATNLKPLKESTQGTKTIPKDDDLRFTFGGFSMFGNKPVVPSPGFVINKLKVRRGGVAIAGPGGVATAGKGGAAIVGPGGLAYTQPGGLAVAGPSSRVVALTSDVDLSSIVTRLQQQQIATDGSVPRLLEAIPEGKIVAIEPGDSGEDLDEGESTDTISVQNSIDMTV